MRTDCYRLYPVDVSLFSPSLRSCLRSKITSEHHNLLARFCRVCKYIKAGPFAETDSTRCRRKCELDVVGPPIFIRLCFDSPRLCGKLAHRALADSHGNSVATPVACAWRDGRVRLKCDVRHLSTHDAFSTRPTGGRRGGEMWTAIRCTLVIRLKGHSTRTFRHG